ncbi:YfhO family protein [Streptomyces griseorubiginosus]|uniref:YfhO family protein n=1 Tax=Streptomyces griseorubiginosus TaxID=67304 RepID=UPI001AD69BD4|nr:YfhO family protein [Streptomyces griseorubiginosus]MBO4255082.1 YfhO family protein [Streptomyces griseorubiginosus]
MSRSTLSKAVSGGRFRTRGAAALLAAVLTTAVFCVADAAARSYPFGPRTRDVNDLGNQYVPFHAHLWDLLHGKADGGLFINWQSGFGSSFLPDLGTYLSSPFALLVGVFPRHEIDLAVYVITVLKTATAGAAMAWLLLSLRSGRWWAAGLLGASYGLCGWSVAVASYNPMWLDGLIALPLFCLVGEWTLRRRRPLLGMLVVTEAWIANFYTAYMATLAAGLVLLLRLWLSDLSRRQRLRAAGRAAATVALGVGLAAPLVTVIYFGTKHAYPGRVVHFTPVSTEDLLARLLPTTYTFGSPALYAGTAALLLALALPFHRAVPVRVRVAWTALVVAVTLSLQWEPTHLVWHAFATPQGSPYRQAFVLCGLVVVAAWHALSYGPPDWRALGAATGLLALITAVASRSALVQHLTWVVLSLAVVGALGGLVLLRLADTASDTTARRGLRTAFTVLAVALLFGGQFGEAMATFADASRQRLRHMDNYAPWGQRQERQSELIAQTDDWPAYRTDAGREQTVANDPMLVGGQGAQYYSSLTSDVLSRTLTALGGGWTSRGRSLQSLDNAVTDAIFSIGARVHSPPDPHQDWFPRDGTAPTVSREAVPPLVTVRPSAAAAGGFGESPYRNQELLLGSRVYTVPPITLRDDSGQPVQGGQVGSGSAAKRPVITARCPAGSQAYLWAPRFSGTARLGGDTARFRSLYPRNRAAMEPLGQVPSSGRLRITLTPNRPGLVPDGALGCLDTERLRSAVDHLKATGATRVTVSDGTIHAELPAGSKGTAVVAAPRIAGWRCAAGGGDAQPAKEFHGLIAVPLDGESTSLTCTFRPPGLRLGTVVGAASLLTLALLGVLTAVRRRRTPEPSSSATIRPRERVSGAL